MLSKMTKNRIIVLAVFLLITPMILSAAGTKETAGGNVVTLNEDVMVLLEKVESGEITLDAAKADFVSLEKEYQITTQERAQIQKMMEAVGAGDKTAKDCEDQLKKQLQTRERIQSKTEEKVQTNSSSDKEKGGSESSSMNKD